MKTFLKILVVGLTAITVSCSQSNNGSPTGSTSQPMTSTSDVGGCAKKEGSPCQPKKEESPCQPKKENKSEPSPCNPPKKSEPSPCAKPKSSCSSQSDKIYSGQGKRLSAAQKVMQGS